MKPRTLAMLSLALFVFSAGEMWYALSHTGATRTGGTYDHVAIGGANVRTVTSTDAGPGEHVYDVSVSTQQRDYTYFSHVLATHFQADGLVWERGQPVDLSADANDWVLFQQWLPITDVHERTAVLDAIRTGHGTALRIHRGPAIALGVHAFIILASGVTFVVASFAARAAKRRLEGCCTTCGYPRLPDPQSPCPECGTLPKHPRDEDEAQTE